MLVIMAISMGTGNPSRLIYGTDYMGSTCATGANEQTVTKELEKMGKTPAKAGMVYWSETSWNNYYKNRKEITYPRTNIDQLVNKLVGGNLEIDYPTLPNFYGLCTAKCTIAREKFDKDFLISITDLPKKILENTDVVCSIQASQTIQKMCIDERFTSNFNNSVFDRRTPLPYTFDEWQKSSNMWDRYSSALGSITTPNSTMIKYGQIMDEDTSDAYAYLLPWAPIKRPPYTDGETGTEQESQCLTQFFDHCHGGGAAEERCRAAGASDAAIAAVNNDCWKQKVNSISVVNRCVASRNVEMDIVCHDPAETVQKLCITSTKGKKDILSGERKKSQNTCINYWNGTYVNSNGKIGDWRPRLNEEGKPYRYVCADEPYECNTNCRANLKLTSIPSHPDQCWQDKGFGLGKWLVKAYNNSGSAELSPAEIAQKVSEGASGISNPGYCAESITITKTIYGVKTNQLFEWLNGAGKVAAGWFADFEKTKTPILVSGIVLSMIMAFAWIVLMKNFGKCVCWTTLVLSIMTVIALNLCLYVKAGIIGQDILGGFQAIVAAKNPEIADQIPNSFPDYLQPSETRKSLYKWSAMAMTVFILIILVAMVRFRQKINVAIQMCKEAAAAITAMPLIVFWPFLNVILLVSLMVYFIYIAMYIASAASLQNVNQDLKAKYDEKMIGMKDAANYAIDKSNQAGAASTAAYNQKATEWDKAGYSASDWNAVQHMSYNASTVEPLNFKASSAIRGMLVYHTIGMWWIALVIVTVGNYTIASAVSQWYFNAAKYLEQSKAKKRGAYNEKVNCYCCKCSVKEQMNSPITDACKKGCRYHCGSFALGSALTILVFFLKIAFLWINKLVSMISSNNACARKIKACMFVGMGIFDKFIRIVGRNGYIMMAIRGQNFCTSAGWASWLIFAAQDNPKNLSSGAKDLKDRDNRRKKFNKEQKVRITKLKELKSGPTVEYESYSFVSGGEVSKTVKINSDMSKERQIAQEESKLTSYEGPYKEQSYNAAQYAVLSLITDILLFLGKLVVVVSTGLMSYGWITHEFPAGSLTSSAAPIAVSMLFSYFIVSAFMSVYDMSIDTILLCFFYDKLQNKGGPYAMSPQLKKLVLANLPPGTDKTNMRKGDSFFFSKQVTRRGSISIGAGWDAEQSQPTGAAGKKSAAQMSTAEDVRYIARPELDIDLALAIYDKDAKLLDYIGYMKAMKPNGQESMALKKLAGGNLFIDKPGKSMSNINPEAVRWSGDDQKGANSQLNIAGLNEDITVRLHEMPINVDTLAFVLFSFKGPCFNEISDLRLFATECTQSTPGTNGGRRPEIVAKFNCDFEKEQLEGAQQALLCVTLRRNPGPNFPKGEVQWTEQQQEFARKFASKPIKNDAFLKYKDTYITPKLSELKVSEQDYVTIVSQVEGAHEAEYDAILSEQMKNKNTRSLTQKLAAHKEVVARDIIFNVFAKASRNTLGGKTKGLSPEQLMIWNRTYSQHNKGTSGKPRGDMIGKDEDYFDCAWEIQAQRELMTSKKFDAGVVNAIAQKCFFFRDPGDKFADAHGSYCGSAIAAAGAMVASA